MSKPMAFVTLEIGPFWKMQLLLGVLQERGLPGFVADANMSLLNPLATGPLGFDARLQVPEEALESARAALQEARTESSAGMLVAAGSAEAAETEDAALVPPELRALADLGLRIRFAALCPWLHPLLFAYRFSYVRALQRTDRAPAGNGLTLLTLGVVSAIWSIAIGLVVSGVRF